MPAGQRDGLLRQLRRVALRAPGDEPGDAELLDRFITRHDAAAFELLIRRHGPMVLGVCQRVLRNGADAEDAFQATFVVFVRKAKSIVPRSKLGNWLYGVAHKTALKARAMNRRRHAREHDARAAARPNSRDKTWATLLDVLDDELSVLPEKYRAAIVLCDLEGLSYREAAAQLGCLQGTLSGRLTRARALLARRLARHGPALSAGALASLLTRNASAAVRPSLTASTSHAGTMLMVERALTAGVVSARVASIAEGVLKMMLLTRLKIVTGLLLCVAAVVVAGWLCVARVSAHALIPEADAVPGRDEARTPIRKEGLATRGADAGEAEFVFLTGDRGKKSVALLVAGTSSPVLKLPVKDSLRVLVGEQRIGLDDLRAGARVLLRMDVTNGMVQEIRALEDVPSVATLRMSREAERFDPPSNHEVLQALPRATAPVNALYEVFRDDVSVVAERLAHKADPPRFFPLVGRARLNHCHWKCTVYFTETVTSSYPFPFRSRRPCVEVLYFDKDYLMPIEQCVATANHPASSP